MGILIYVVVLLFSVIMHEFAHAYVAYLRGDDTAKYAGRLTLNPIPHIELFGSIILPAMLILLHAPILFGWAKPVPINGAKFKNPKIDVPLVSAAGPMANVLIAVFSGIGIRIINMIPSFEQGFGGAISSVLYIMVIINVVLLIINMVPVPPLDGSKIITFFLPVNIAIKYMRLNPFVGMMVLIILLWSGILWKIIGPLINFLVILLSGIPLR